jgi:hypothetical protein
MHAALDVNIPNYASAIASTEEIVASIPALEDLSAHIVRADCQASAAASLEFQKGVHQ